MNEGFKKSSSYSDEWYTPKFIIDSLGKFDLDPCAPINPLWQTAKIMYNKTDDGLTKDWIGRVWLNPPYSRPLIEQFVKPYLENITYKDRIKLVLHSENNGSNAAKKR